MDSLRTKMLAELSGLPEGMCIEIPASEFLAAFASRSIYGPRDFESENRHERAIDEFLGSCMGSSYGMWRAYYSNYKNRFVVSRHREEVHLPDNLRYWVSPDRRYLFDRMPDGMWKRNHLPIPWRTKVFETDEERALRELDESSPLEKI